MSSLFRNNFYLQFPYNNKWLQQAGREGRTKFGDKKGRANEFASTSNKEKLRNKNFMMVRQKVKKNAKKATFHDKKVST